MCVSGGGGQITYTSAPLFKMSKTSLIPQCYFVLLLQSVKWKWGPVGQEVGWGGHLSARWKAGLTSDLIFLFTYELLMSGHGPVV